MDEFEQRSREIARAILERHGWKRPMTAEVKEMREIADEPLTECKRYLIEEWQNMRIPLLEAENEKLRELLWELFHCSRQVGCDCCETIYRRNCGVLDRIRELGIEVDV